MRKALLTLAVAGGLLVGALPAQAGTLEWTDKKGDATSFYVAEGNYLPNDPSLDVVKVTMKADAKTLTWVAHMDKMANQPNYGGGYFYRFEFTYGGAAWTMRAKNDALEKAVYFRINSDNVGFDLPCKDCKVGWETKENQIRVTLPIESLAAGIKAATSSSACPGCRGTTTTPIPELKKGAEFTALRVTAQRSYVRLTLTSDNAPAPADAVFTL